MTPSDMALAHRRLKVANLTNFTDVRQLNVLQFMNGHHDVYLDKRSNSGVDVTRAFDNRSSNRRKRLAVVNEQAIESDTGKGVKFLTMYPGDVRIGLPVGASRGVLSG
jgi:hypothetical protein